MMTLQEVITLAKNGHWFKATNGEFTYTERAFKNADYWTQKDVLANWRVIGMRKTPKYEKIVKEYLEELEHFFISGIGGWPIILEGKRHERLMKLVPCLYINESNRLALKKNAKPDPNIMAELYKYKYEEISNMYSKLYSKVQPIRRELQMKTIKVREDENGNPYILLEELIPGHQYQVDSYTMEAVDGNDTKKLILQFFDKDGNVINVNLEE